MPWTTFPVGPNGRVKSLSKVMITRPENRANFSISQSGNAPKPKVRNDSMRSPRA